MLTVFLFWMWILNNNIRWLRLQGHEWWCVYVCVCLLYYVRSCYKQLLECRKPLAYFAYIVNSPFTFNIVFGVSCVHIHKQITHYLHHTREHNTQHYTMGKRGRECARKMSAQEFIVKVSKGNDCWLAFKHVKIILAELFCSVTFWDLNCISYVFYFFSVFFFFC